MAKWDSPVWLQRDLTVDFLSEGSTTRNTQYSKQSREIPSEEGLAPKVGFLDCVWFEIGDIYVLWFLSDSYLLRRNLFKWAMDGNDRIHLTIIYWGFVYGTFELT
jgi:hypothetical protein